MVPVNVTISEEIQNKLDNNIELTAAELQTALPRKAWAYGKTSSTRTTLAAANVEPYGSGYETETAEYIAMATSVLKNGGFYVGRYEGGTYTARTAATDAKSTLLSKADVYPYNFIAWGKAANDTGEVNAGNTGAVELCREKYTGKDGYGVNSSLIYATQWDSIMEWIEKERNVSTSTEWGNYSNRAYTIPAGTEYYNGSLWTITENDLNKSGSALLKTGGYANTKTNGAINTDGVIKNIYDLSGNLGEWTMEANSISKVYRSGSYAQSGSNYPSADRNTSAPNSITNAMGVRLAIYIR